VDVGLDTPILHRLLDELEAMFRLRRHLATTEMPLVGLAGKGVLEIGCGAGGHSALFARHGAHMISLDLTFERARACAGKFSLLGASAESCISMQGDGEQLPFPDSTFDIVYSNGVLHHTPDTEAAIAEVHRVLKPGGRAVIMLYCRSSFHYWFDLLFCVGLLKGGIFRSRDWMGHATEWIGKCPQTAINPVTRCYTARSLRRMFAQFEDLGLRKSEFTAGDIPKLGRLWRPWRERRHGRHPGGWLVYGAPWQITTPFERRLGSRIGWAWNISAVKPGGNPR
jgi:ubiquinone/menaquinone biosynthesis C-methylase UbiE